MQFIEEKHTFISLYKSDLLTGGNIVFIFFFGYFLKNMFITFCLSAVNTFSTRKKNKRKILLKIIEKNVLSIFNWIVFQVVSL